MNNNEIFKKPVSKFSLPVYIIIAALIVLGVIVIPSFAEFIIALRNHYSVYPAGTDTNMYGNTFALQLLLNIGLAAIVTFIFKLTQLQRLVIFVLISICFIALSSVIPNFLPHDWCQYELRIYSCADGEIPKVLEVDPPHGLTLTPHPSVAQFETFKPKNLPGDVLPEQIRSVYLVNQDLYALALEPNVNYDLSELRGKTIQWHGILRSQDNGKTWTKFFSIIDPDDSGLAGYKIKYNPVGVFAENQKIYADIVNDRGAGSGEGQLIRFFTSDAGTTWQRMDCYYFIPEHYDLAYTDGGPSRIDPYKLERTENCLY